VKATRRQAVLGALAVPAVASAAKLKAASPAVVVYDPSLVPSPTANAQPIEGDPIRFARALFERRPSLVLGVSRRADALLIEEVGREADYAPVTQSLHARFGWSLAPRS
jgi:hypothetical protein